MTRLKNNLAAKSNNFEEIDKTYAYMIFIVEKEFNVGAIGEDYFMMKLWNLFDEYNLQRYGRETDPKKSGSNNSKMTFR